MANNRMYLRCRKCGSTFFMGKCYLDGYFTNNGYYDGKVHRMFGSEDFNTPDAFLDAYNDFLDKHAYCTEPLDEREINYIGTPFKQVDSYYERFEIAYEISDEKLYGKGKEEDTPNILQTGTIKSDEKANAFYIDDFNQPDPKKRRKFITKEELIFYSQAMTLVNMYHSHRLDSDAIETVLDLIKKEIK